MFTWQTIPISLAVQGGIIKAKMLCLINNEHDQNAACNCNSNSTAAIPHRNYGYETLLAEK